MNRQIKSVDVNASVDQQHGSITGYAATFIRTPDYAGDVIAQGAFSKCLERIKEDGTVLPLLYDHDQALDSFIGTVTDIAEDEHGLLFTATFDDTKKAQRARELALDGRLAKFSFAYEIVDQAEIELEDGTKANELRELNIMEVSLVLTPCNPDTSVVEVKDAKHSTTTTTAAKSGRRNSKADESKLREMREHVGAIQSILNDLLGEGGDEPQQEQQVEDIDEQGEKAAPDEPDANAEDPDEGNAEEQTDEQVDAEELEREEREKARIAALVKQAEEILNNRK